MPRIDLARVPVSRGAGYPPPFDQPCAGRTRQRLGDAGGLTEFGVNRMTLPPGRWSSHRHWHSHEDPPMHATLPLLAATDFPPIRRRSLDTFRSTWATSATRAACTAMWPPARSAPR
jgi:hypothetical protein